MEKEVMDFDAERSKIVEAILFAESESDWDEVSLLYKKLFALNDHEKKIKDIREKGWF